MHEYDANEYADPSDAGADDAGGDDGGPLSDSSYAAYDSADAGDDAFQATYTDGEEVDLDGNGTVDGVATVTYDDLDGDGVVDHASISIVADTDGDGTDETVVLINEYDTDQDGYSDAIDVTSGVDTDGDGAVDESSYSSGTIEHSTAEDGSTTQSVIWDDADAGDTASGDAPSKDDNSVAAFDMLDSAYSEDVTSAYVDPATGEWVETTTSA